MKKSQLTGNLVQNPNCFKKVIGIQIDYHATILTGRCQAQMPPIRMGPVYSNSHASVDPQWNWLCIIFTSLV